MDSNQHANNTAACLITISKYLTVAELAVTASTCTQFRTIARDIFSQRYKSNCLEIDMDLRQLRRPDRRKYLRQTTAMLRNFGDLWTKLKIKFFYRQDNSEYNNTFLFNMMVNYCTGAIDRLELCNCMYLQLDKILDPAALFRNVKELELNFAHSIDNSFLSDAKELIHLNMHNFGGEKVVKILSNDYLKLQALTLLYRLETLSTTVDVVSFLKRHSNVVELKLHDCRLYDLSAIGECSAALRKLFVSGFEAAQIPAIAELDKLTELEIYIGRQLESPSPIQLLNATKSSHSLQQLVIWCHALDDGRELPAALVRFPNLTHLSVITWHAIINDFLTALHSLRKLRVLSIGSNFQSLTAEDLVELVRQLPHLKELCVYPNGCGVFERIDLLELTYLKIYEIQRHRNQKLTIYNFDSKNSYLMKQEQKEPFAGFDQHEFVQFITLEYPERFRGNRSVQI